jgi:ubiquinone/menaquinone biosynthesis C-methylase UbiE
MASGDRQTMRNWDTLYQERGVVQKEPSPRASEAVKFFRMSRASRILDLGCGTGRHAAYLLKSGFKVCGCDSSAVALRIAKEFLPEVEFQRCDTGSLPYQDECADGIFCHAVIQHGTLATIRKAIQEIHRVLRTGGALFLTVTSTEHPEYLTGQEIERGTKINIDAIDGDMPHHYFTEQEILDFFGCFVMVKLEHYKAPSEKTPGRIAAMWAICARRRSGSLGKGI